MERRSGSVEVTAGPTMLWREIMTHGDFEVTLLKLLNMLREVESVIKKEKLVLYIGETKKKRKANKILKKGKGKERPGKAKVAKRDSAKDKG
ncbi:hypothetical protein B296_00045519 [Ensete ventricosum]|uniref:Uncharacterized protein n=1 Tax=Ensete ventricosum TaxID=4639 RepID=A0A426XDF2_ENSVE|nr:hypothetical protein B296_00045519 [Ensete ventricosum]